MGVQLRSRQSESFSQFVLDCITPYEGRIAQVNSETGEVLTFGALLVRALSLAAGLQARGLGPDDIAVLIGENNPHYPWVMLGVIHSGAAVHLLNPRSTKREVEQALAVSRPKFALISSSVAKDYEVISALRGAGCLHQVLVYDGASDSASDLLPGVSTLMRSSDRLQRRPVTRVAQGSAAALLISSSGTTGVPKAVVLTHSNCIAGLRNRSPYPQPDDIVAAVAPYYHVMGCIMLLHSMCSGNTVVSVPHFNLDDLVGTIARFRISAIHLVPSLLSTLVAHPAAVSGGMGTLRRVLTGGALLSAQLQEEVARRLRHVTLINGYGMSESMMGPMMGVVRADKPGSVGKLVPMMECKLKCVETGAEVSVDTPGEILVRSATIMAGYYNNPEATREALDSDGWLHTGDIAYVDRDGYYFIVDRLKNIFKYNGHQVSPSEIEMVLETHPAVREAAVIGVPHKYGDAPFALVVREEGATVTVRELKSLVAERLAAHNQLRGGLIFVESLPKTASGKLSRANLKSCLQASQSRPEAALSVSSSCRSTKHLIEGHLRSSL